MNPDQLNLEVANPDLKLVSEYKPWSIFVLYAIGLISWIFALIGFIFFFEQNPNYWFFAIPVVIFTLYYIPNYLTNLFYRQPDISKYLEDSLNQKEWPDVDIFLPICGGSKEILVRTWDFIQKLDYAGKYKVFIGDDSGCDWVKDLTKEYGFNYLSRPDRGVMKKTGNLDFMFKNSSSDFFVVFDADFCPKPNFLKITIPQILKSPKIAILQTPQSFFKGENDLEDAASASQIDFYKVIQNSRDYFDGAICVGSNSVSRRSAVSETKVYQWLIDNNIDHGEDVNTGFYLITKGWKVKYLPVELAFGNSASTMSSLIKQRNRWSSSSTRMFLTGIVGMSNLSLMQKICYYTGFLYYVSDLFKFILSYMLFAILLSNSNLNILNALWFLPHIAFGLILMPIYRKTPPTFASKAVDTTLVYTHIYTLCNRLMGRGASWVPTGNVTKKDRTVVGVKRLFYLNFTVYVLVTIILSFKGKIQYSNPQAYTVIFWIFYFIATHIATFYYMSMEGSKNQKTSNLNLLKSVEKVS